VAEGARLESVFRGNSNVGSNPTLSASHLILLHLAAIHTAIHTTFVRSGGWYRFPLFPKVPNVNLTKYVNLGENEWRFCPVVIAVERPNQA
jgi:hypothetical protein